MGWFGAGGTTKSTTKKTTKNSPKMDLSARSDRHTSDLDLRA